MWVCYHNNMEKDKQVKTKNQSKVKEDKLPNLIARLEAVRGEYQYSQNARNALHTRTGILIAVLSALVSVAFIRDCDGIIELFETNPILAYIRVLLLGALFVSFFITLISYISVFFTHTYRLFPYAKYTFDTEENALKLSNETVIIAMYKDYAECIDNNKTQFEKLVTHYRVGNVFLIITVFFTVCTLVTTLI